MMLAVFTGDINLLRHTAILFIPTRIPAVDDDILPAWQDSIVETVKAVQEERAGQVFIDTLGQLLASGELVLATNMREPEEPRPGTTIVGYLDEHYVYLLPDMAHRAVLRVQPLKFNAPAIGAQLKEDGWLIPGPNSLTGQRRIRGIPTRLWQLKAEFLVCDDGDTGSVPANTVNHRNSSEEEGLFQV